MLAGTPGFQPPEQLRAEAIGTPCDVYAYGGVLAILFGEKPLWPGLSAFQVMCKVTIEAVKPALGHLPGCIQALCYQCFADVSVRPCIGAVLANLLKICRDQ